jgi:lipoprotein signal peptidase
MGLTGMVFSVIAAVVGAIMYFAITTQGTGFRLSTVGIILMIAGGIGFVISAAVFGVSRQSNNKHTFDRQATDAKGVSTAVHEETH